MQRELSGFQTHIYPNKSCLFRVCVKQTPPAIARMHSSRRDPKLSAAHGDGDNDGAESMGTCDQREESNMVAGQKQVATAGKR